MFKKIKKILEAVRKKILSTLEKIIPGKVFFQQKYEMLSSSLTKLISKIIPDKEIEKTSIIFWFIALFTVSAIIWGSIAKIEQVVRAQGQVIPASKMQVVQSLYTGVITDIAVKLGDNVVKDQKLFSINATNAEAKYQGNEEAYTSTLLELETRQKRVDLIENLVDEGAESEMRLLDEKLVLIDTQRRLSQISSNREAFKQEKDNSIIRAPVDGEISIVYVTTEGEVIQSGKLLAEIVPKGDKLLIEANVLTKDISFVSKGQKAKVSFSSYDASVYGSFDGIVTEISASTNRTNDNSQDTQPYYSALIEVTDIAGLKSKNITIRSGMQVDASIIGQERTVIGFIFNPITKLTRKAFRE